MILHTIGYEGRHIDDFINILLKNKIELLVDIRAVPHSRNRDYSKNNLEKRLAENGIAYLLKKELGSPKELRDKVKSDGDYANFFGEYERFLEEKTDHIIRLSGVIKTKNICLLCYETDAGRCHRSSVANRLKSRDINLEIVNL